LPAEQPPGKPLIEAFSLEPEENGILPTEVSGKTSIPGVFATGDCVSGAWDTVHALYQGRITAQTVHTFLQSL
jgi:NADPH-dependent glutamate synthase beta subunit-like oxidoreductase